jgi:LexA-binding, inner membrane-associated putative hydrolase
MSITHATIAVAGTSLILGTASPLPLALAILGSQLPDIDTTTSTIGQICYPIAQWIETRYPHCTFVGDGGDRSNIDGSSRMETDLEILPITRCGHSCSL